MIATNKKTGLKFDVWDRYSVDKIRYYTLADLETGKCKTVPIDILEQNYYIERFKR